MVGCGSVEMRSMRMKRNTTARAATGIQGRRASRVACPMKGANLVSQQHRWVGMAPRQHHKPITE